MKGALVEDYGNNTFRSLARGVLSNFLLKNQRLPFFVSLDASIIHYKPWSQIVFNPQAKGGWKAILERYWSSEPYRLLNHAVAGDPLLSKYAAINFLNALLKKSEEEQKRHEDRDGRGREDPVGALMSRIDRMIQQGNPSADRVITAVSRALEEEAEETLRDIEAAESFTHIGVPVASLLERPDEFREKARNKIIVYLVKFLRRLEREAPGLKSAKSPTLVGGRPLGVKRIQRWSELSRILPIDYLDDDLLAYRIASRTVRVSESYGSIQNYVVYLDKSGSMGSEIYYRSSPTQAEYVPKISFAAASALALAHQLRRLGARMTLKLFDTEVHDPIADYARLIDVLARIRADSGTNISNVLEDALRHRDDKIIVVTDGIDQVSEDSVRNARSSGLDITFVFIKTDNELIRRNFPCIHLREAEPEVLLRI
jgi:uncharacterized protein with von Willebrand factor type A (vWA) domain